MKLLTAWTLTWLALLIPLTSRAAAPLVLLGDSTGSYTLMRDALQQHYRGELESSTLPASLPFGQRLVIGLGSQACREGVDHAEAGSRLLCIFLPAQTFDELSRTDKGRTLLKQRRLSALYLDQPLDRQMRLAKLLLPTIDTIGTVLGPESDALAAQFSASAKKLGLKPIIGHLKDDDNPVQVLTPIIERSDLFLPLPDRSVFNRAAAKWILYITLRNQVPLIGFSSKYADAGAVVALYTSIDQIALEGAELIETYQAGKPLPPPSYPRSFSITVNQTAAHTLGIQIPVAAQLIEQLEASEGH